LSRWNPSGVSPGRFDSSVDTSSGDDSSDAGSAGVKGNCLDAAPDSSIFRSISVRKLMIV